MSWKSRGHHTMKHCSMASSLIMGNIAVAAMVDYKSCGIWVGVGSAKSKPGSLSRDRGLLPASHRLPLCLAFKRFEPPPCIWRIKRSYIFSNPPVHSRGALFSQKRNATVEQKLVEKRGLLRLKSRESTWFT